MKPLNDFPGNSEIRFILTDIDDTLTNNGQLGPEAYQALWNLQKKGFQIIPITGRPAGWCEMIARFWPVAGVVGENGAFYFCYKSQKMIRHFAQGDEERLSGNEKLEVIKKEVLENVPGTAVASDQFCRLQDLAIDFCEDVPALSKDDVRKIVDVFEKHGAIAKVSSIHVNGWFGDHNKISMSVEFLNREFGLSEDQIKSQCIFVGDSPNDEPMFEYFPLSFAVSNIKEFESDLNHLPTFVADSEGGEGFVEIAQRFL